MKTQSNYGHGYSSTFSNSQPGSGGSGRSYPKYRETTRKKVFKKMLQDQREAVIEMDIRIKMYESVLEAIESGRIDDRSLGQTTSVGQLYKELIEELKHDKEIGIVMLDALKDMRPPHNLNTEENRRLAESAPTINVTSK